MLDFVLKPVRAVFKELNEDALRPLEETERETLGAVKAIENATDSIEHHVEVIETLATSVGPLTESVDRLNQTLSELVRILGPLGSAEREVHQAEQEIERAEHFFGRLRRQRPIDQERVADPAAPGPDRPAPGR